MNSTRLPGLALSQLQHSSNTPEQIAAAQQKLVEARQKLKLDHTEAAKAVVDPSATRPPLLTARQRAKYPKLTPANDILTLVTPVATDPWARLSSSEQYLLQPGPPSVEPFYAQLEEIRRVQAQFHLLASLSNAQINPQARR